MKKNKTLSKARKPHAKKDNYIQSMENWLEAQDAYIEHLKRRCIGLTDEMNHYRKRLILEKKGVQLALKSHREAQKNMALYKKAKLKGNHETIYNL